MIKRVIVIMILWLLTEASFLGAAEIKLAWDTMPAGESWTFVRAYERSGSAPSYSYTQVGEVAQPANVMTLANVIPGKHVYIVRSCNGIWESGDSNAVGTPAVPSTPVGIEITIIIKIMP